MQAIQTRRSVRAFTNKSVDEKQLELLLRAAMQAPSARNFQSWHFVVIQNRSLLDRIPEFHPYAEMARTAQAAICVCGDLDIEPSAEYNALNCAAATQNLLLAAHDQDLGAVWLGVYPRDERMRAVAKVLQLPAHVIPISLMMIGYPAVQPQPEDRFRPERIHRESWQ